jgi:hypothetical protein
MIKEDTTNEELEKEKQKLEKDLESLRKNYKTLMTKLTKTTNRISEIDSELDKRNLKGNDIEKLLETFPETETKEKLLRDLLSKFDLSAEGYFPDTGQRCIQISLEKDSKESLQKTYYGLKLLLPYLKPVKDGNIYVDIFESTLSRFGIYTLIIKKEKFEVEKTTCGHPETIYSNKDLKKVLEYIQKHHYYE